MENLLLQLYTRPNVVIDFKRYKQTPCGDRSAAHLHFKIRVYSLSYRTLLLCIPTAD